MKEEEIDAIFPTEPPMGTILIFKGRPGDDRLCAAQSSKAGWQYSRGNEEAYILNIRWENVRGLFVGHAPYTLIDYFIPEDGAESTS